MLIKYEFLKILRKNPPLSLLTAFLFVGRTMELYGNPANSLGISKDTKLLCLLESGSKRDFCIVTLYAYSGANVPPLYSPIFPGPINIL